MTTYYHNYQHYYYKGIILTQRRADKLKHTFCTVFKQKKTKNN